MSEVKGVPKTHVTPPSLAPPPRPPAPPPPPPPHAPPSGPVTRWTPERRRQQTREVLLDAAAQVFAERGFEGASLEEIAAAAGYSRGAIYKNFGGKEELFLAVNERFNERTLAAFGELADEGSLGFDVGSVAEAAERWRAMFFRDARLHALNLEFQLYVLRHPEVQARVTEYTRRTMEMVTQFMDEQAAAYGVTLPYPTDVLARIFVYASDGFQAAARVDPDGPDLITPLLELFMRAVAAPGDGPVEAGS